MHAGSTVRAPMLHSRSALAVAIGLHVSLITFGILRTQSVVRANHLFPFADKLWHALYYALLAMLLHAVFRHRIFAAAVLALFAVVDEAVQSATPGRSASLLDLAVDLLAGMAVIWWASRVRAT